MPKMFQHCCHSAEKWSELLPSTAIIFLRCCLWKSTIISVQVCFSALLPTMPIIFPLCGLQCGKMIIFVAYTAENYRRCWHQSGKMFKFEYLHEFETICEFSPGGFNQGPRLMCFMKKSWGEKYRGTVPLTMSSSYHEHARLGTQGSILLLPINQVKNIAACFTSCEILISQLPCNQSLRLWIRETVTFPVPLLKHFYVYTIII